VLQSVHRLTESAERALIERHVEGGRLQMLVQLQHVHHAPIHERTVSVLRVLGGDARNAEVDVDDVSQAVQIEIARLPQPR
jgi:hypothetical protein